MTARELILHWAVRDQLYTLRKLNGVTHPLDANEVDAIKANRKWEVDQLPANERARPHAIWLTWQPPT